jgi:hypothetical protein
MELIVNILAPVLVFIAGFTGNAEVAMVQASAQDGSGSVELGLLQEFSPRGEAGGFAMPASGCSAADPRWHGNPIHDCDTLPDISTDKPIIRLGDPVEIFWDPRSHTNCILSANLMALSPVPDGNVAGSREDSPEGETTYSIVCDGAGNSDTVTVKVLPRIQET